MKAMKSIAAILFMATMAIFISMLFSINITYVLGGLLLLSFLPKPQGVMLNTLERQIWQNDIIENLYADNAFALRSFNADQFVLDGKVVHVPVSGTARQTKKNLTSFPQTAVDRADSKRTYEIDTYYSLPRRVEHIAQYELSYDKRMSVVGDDVKNLVNDAMTGLLYRWSPAAANVFATTGDATAEDLIDDVATGQRKVFTKAEFKKVAKKFANTNLGGVRINALLTANHYHQFFESLSDAEKTNFNNVADLGKGVIGMYMGINVMMRSTVVRYRKVAGVWTVVDVQDEDFEPATGDSSASLFWADNCVERALGDVKTFDDTDNPLYYGDIYSALVRLGGQIRRVIGVYAVVEDIV